MGTSEGRGLPIDIATFECTHTPDEGSELVHQTSAELRKAFSEVKDKPALADFLKKHGCEASVDEFEKFIKSQREGEIEDDVAEASAGGGILID